MKKNIVIAALVFICFVLGIYAMVQQTIAVKARQEATMAKQEAIMNEIEAVRSEKNAQVQRTIAEKILKYCQDSKK